MEKTTNTLTDSRLASLGAKSIFDSFKEYQSCFKTITQRAKNRFQQRDWAGAHEDAMERLEIYKKFVDRLVAEIRPMLDCRVEDKLVWTSMKAVYSALIADRNDWELAETFFNSVTRRIFSTVGLDPQIEYVDTDFETPPTQAGDTVYTVYEKPASLPALVDTILADFDMGVPYFDRPGDVKASAAEIENLLKEKGCAVAVDKAEIIKSVFYRRKGAYIIGRLFCSGQLVPLTLALLHSPQGVVVDAVLTKEDDLNILFSFTRSYFHVDVERPYDLVKFLKSVMPNKRIAELYISIGYNKHGKTELYRNLLHHLATSNDPFEIAKGEPGMVMLVFTLPSYDLVFKLIRDHFAYPKNTTRQAVMAQYNRVFQHDRAGRLIDAQEFEHLKFERSRFSPALLNELLEKASQTVKLEGDHVIIRHAYVERRVIPLNLFIREAPEEAAVAAVIDCGNAIKDLASTDIFTGDMLLKNFGVTRHGRVVFYDYDELCSVSSCKVREMPLATNTDDELSAEPWFAVGENDMFPEEFPYFLGLRDHLRAAFYRYHGDLFDVHYWRQVQARLLDGEVIDIYPYSQGKRLKSSVRGEQIFSSAAHALSYDNL